MKKFITSLFASLALCAALVSPANAQEVKTFAGTGTATSATYSTYIVPIGTGTPRVQYINATADNATNAVHFYTPAAPVVVTTTTNATQAIVYAPGITGTPKVVIYRRSAGTYEYGVVSSVAAGYITLTANTTATTAGDQVFVMTLGGTIPVGNATKEVNASSGAAFNGTKGRPLLVVCSGASAATINAIAGKFE